MKKFFITVLLCFTALFALLGFSACDNSETPPPTYTVTFANLENVDAVMPPAQTVEEGKTATCPTEVPTAEGYEFDGWIWFTEGDVFSTPITQDVTIWATWSPVVIITFDSNGGTPVAEQKYLGSYSVHLPQAPETPIKEGFYFLGWYQENGEQFLFNNLEYSASGIMHLTARWEVALQFSDVEGTWMRQRQKYEQDKLTTDTQFETYRIQDGFLFYGIQSIDAPYVEFADSYELKLENNKLIPYRETENGPKALDFFFSYDHENDVLFKIYDDGFTETFSRLQASMSVSDFAGTWTGRMSYGSLDAHTYEFIPSSEIYFTDLPLTITITEDGNVSTEATMTLDDGSVYIHQNCLFDIKFTITAYTYLDDLILFFYEEEHERVYAYAKFTLQDDTLVYENVVDTFIAEMLNTLAFSSTFERTTEV